MPFIPVPNVVEYRMVHTYLNQRLTNSIYVQYDQPPSPNDLQTGAQQIAQLWAANIIPNLSSDCVFTEVYARDLSFQSSFVYTFTGTPLPVSGSAFGQPMPSHVAVVVSLRTGLAGRSYRGRLYIGGLTELQVDGDYPNPAVRNAITVGVSAVIVGMLGATQRPVVVSRYQAGLPRNPGVATPILSVLNVTRRVASQRKRLP